MTTFNPTDESLITGLSPVLWIDFSDAATVTTASGNVSQVDDKSGNGYHFTQSTAGSRPAYISAAQNGLNVARFDGSADFLSLGSSALFQNVGGGSIYIVRKIDVAPPAVGQNLWDSSNGTSTSRTYIRVTATNLMGIGGRRLDADTFSFSTGSATMDTAYGITTAVYNWTNSDTFTYDDKASDLTNTSFQTSGSTSNTAAHSATIGASAGGASFFDGDIAEIIAFHAVHTATQRDTVLNFLGFKWGLFTLDVV